MVRVCAVNGGHGKGARMSSQDGKGYVGLRAATARVQGVRHRMVRVCGVNRGYDKCARRSSQGGRGILG